MIEWTELTEKGGVQIPVSSGYNPNLFIPVRALGLSDSIQENLKKEDVFVIDLIIRTEAELFRQPGIGRKSLNTVKEALKGIGLHLGMDVPLPGRDGGYYHQSVRNWSDTTDPAERMTKIAEILEISSYRIASLSLEHISPDDIAKSKIFALLPEGLRENVTEKFLTENYSTMKEAFTAAVENQIETNLKVMRSRQERPADAEIWIKEFTGDYAPDNLSDDFLWAIQNSEELKSDFLQRVKPALTEALSGVLTKTF